MPKGRSYHANEVIDECDAREFGNEILEPQGGRHCEERGNDLSILICVQEMLDTEHQNGKGRTRRGTGSEVSSRTMDTDCPR